MARNRSLGLHVVVICAALHLGCGGTHDGHANSSISESQALQIAVAAANEECMSRFSIAPFDSSSSSIEFRNGRWFWGGLDVAADAGLSASVSFDAQGNDRRVEVYLSTDQVWGLYNGLYK
jgi:hypothetical protein